MLQKLMNRFFKDEGGALFIYFAIAVVPLLAFIGLSVDISRAYHAQAIVAGAVDAATMAASKVPTDQARTEAQRVFNAYIDNSSIAGKATIKSVEVNEDKGYVQVQADTDVDMTFLRVIGKDFLNVGGVSRVLLTSGSVEVAMVLDNTGSMRGFVNGQSRMNHLKGAAYLFIDTLFEDGDEPDDLFVAMVPYITQVNVGPRTSWLTQSGLATVSDRNKFPRGRGQWMGCMEARLQNNLHLSDTPPLDEATKFNPYWWPSTELFPYPYPNGRIDPWGRRPRGDNDWTSTRISPFASSNPIGPNAGCPAQTLPLTNKEDDLRDKVRDMLAIGRGGTFIFAGLQWGMRSLSPKWRGLWHSPNPHQLPMDWGESQKVIVLLTDGYNQWIGSEAPWNYYRDSHYTSYGRWYGNLHRSLNQNIVRPNTMNDYTREMCDVVKSKGIILYTITFGVQNQPALDLMRYCATDPSYYFEAQSSAQLRSVFKEIAERIGELRYTWPKSEL